MCLINFIIKIKIVQIGKNGSISAFEGMRQNGKICSYQFGFLRTFNAFHFQYKCQTELVALNLNLKIKKRMELHEKE